MSIINLGQIRDLWKTTADWVAGSSSAKPKVQNVNSSGTEIFTSANPGVNKLHSASSATATLQNAVSATGNGTSFDVEGYGVATLQITGTFVATVSFFGSSDGTNFTAIPARKQSDGISMYTTTTTGIYEINCNGLKMIRAAVTWNSGTSITITGRAEPFAGIPTVVNTTLTGSTVDRRGLSSAKPLASTVLAGTTYWSIDLGIKEVSDGTSWLIDEVKENAIDYLTPYGYKIDENNSNPGTAVTYIYGSVGRTPATAENGASASWDATPIYSGIKPCMFKNGVVNYYLSPTNITKKADGVTDADITTGADGDVMVEFPVLHWKMGKVNNEVYAYLSPVKIDNSYKPLAHTVGSTVKNRIWIGAFPGIILNGKLRSLSGQTPTHTQTISQFRTAAQANGAGYQQFGYYQWLMLQHLFYLRFKNRDSQTALGKGYTNLDVIKATGGTNAFPGLYYGTTSDQVSMKCFGIEAFWDYQAHWADGIFIDANWNILIGNQTAYNDNGAGYTNYGQGAVVNTGGYIDTVQGGTETGFIIKTTGGSATTRYADNGNLNASRIALSGGFRTGGTSAGIGQLAANYSGAYAYANIGGRVVYVGADNGVA